MAEDEARPPGVRVEAVPTTPCCRNKRQRMISPNAAFFRVVIVYSVHVIITDQQTFYFPVVYFSSMQTYFPLTAIVHFLSFLLFPCSQSLSLSSSSLTEYLCCHSSDSPSYCSCLFSPSSLTPLTQNLATVVPVLLPLSVSFVCG